MVKVMVVNEPIEVRYEKAKAFQMVSAQDELKYSYDICLNTEQKINILKEMILGINNKELSRNTSRARISILARKQVLEECIDILEKYYAVERVKNNDI